MNSYVKSQEVSLRERQLPLPSREGASLEQQSTASLDARALARQGKRQQLKRNFRLPSAIAFSSVILASWEAIAITINDGLLNGGPVALVYGFLLTWSGTMTLCASIAELASIAPISSAQYHFVAILAPGRASSLLSWISGWITVFAWQVNVCSVAYLTAGLIQGLLVLNYESYVYENWHGTMLYWAVMLVSICINVFGNKILPYLETLMGVLHICLWFTFLIPLVYLAPQSSATWVFTDFENLSGWSSNGISWCVGLLTVTYPFVGFEAVCHISEEIENAPAVVPRSMIISFMINGSLALGFLIGILFGIGNVQDALNTTTQEPLIEIMYQATQSKTAVTAMIALLLVFLECVVVAMVASTSRLTWAFARDNGLPFSKFFAHVSRRYRIPTRAIILNTIVGMLLNLINLGSSTAFEAILSLTTIALYASYLLPIGLMVLRRIKKQEIQFGSFTLGRYGLLVNLFATVYGLFICIFVVFPTQQPVTAVNMNYASLVFGGALTFILVYWYLRGRKIYHGPVEEMVEDEIVLI